eukprot:3265575-Prymnesium_polylepis.1
MRARRGLSPSARSAERRERRQPAGGAGTRPRDQGKGRPGEGMPLKSWSDWQKGRRRPPCPWPLRLVRPVRRSLRLARRSRFLVVAA